MEPVIVIGAGLAGSEAAWQLAQRGIPVQLREMKPQKMSPAHHTEYFGELVCSNSLRSDQLENAVGLLKEELRRCNSLIMACADAHRVEAGGALAVDRNAFAAAITEKIRNHPNITVVEGEVTEIPPEGNVIFATGPLTSEDLSQAIAGLFPDSKYLNFFDAAAPLVTFESVDMDSAWFASRYDRGTPDYINCPMTKEEYEAFWQELTHAQEAEVHGFEDSGVFEGCMPVEVMARRGLDTLRYGPLKPVGLKDPKTGEEPYAVVQLRKDNAQGSIYNIVGFQTHLRWPEQKRVFSMIPALKNAEYIRYGAGPPPGGQAPHQLPPGDGHGGHGPVCQRPQRGELPAHERELRTDPPAGLSGEGQAEQECRDIQAGAGKAGRAGPGLSERTGWI